MILNMEEYNVLSNSAFIKIIYHAIYGIIMLGGLANYLGKRNARSDTHKKSFFRKAIPWVLSCVLLSDLALFSYRLICYPWSEDPMPLQGSILRELQYDGDDFIICGWANDYQLAILMPLAGMALWTFWVVYAFSFIPSATSWWKRVCKVIAYIIISVSILGFRVHSFEDLLYWAIILAIVIVLLYVAAVRKTLVKKQELSPVDEHIKPEEPMSEQHFSNSKEYNERFVPKPRNVEFKEGSFSDETTKTEGSLLTEDVIPKEKNKEDLSEVRLAEIPKDEEKPLFSSQAENPNDDMMFCKYCGKRIEADSCYCKFCGKKL